MPVRRLPVGLGGPEQLGRSLRDAQYIASEGLATVTFLALSLGKPLLLEGAPGVGKTEAAKAIASILGRELVRLQCYEGIDSASAMIASAVRYSFSHFAAVLAPTRGTPGMLSELSPTRAR